MGQAESSTNVPDSPPSPSPKEHNAAAAAAPTTPVTSDKTQPSMESLLAEAAAYGDNDEHASIDEKAQKALDCPCIANLRNGKCGSQFSESFLCFLKSTAEEKGSDCVTPFVALQACIKSNPDTFPKDVLEDEDDKKEEKAPAPEYKIYPPRWSLESNTPRHKL